MPEIDMPGHSQAAVAAYPWPGNADVAGAGSPQVWTDWGISPHVLETSDAALRFGEIVMEEVLELVPSLYVHIG